MKPIALALCLAAVTATAQAQTAVERGPKAARHTAASRKADAPSPVSTFLKWLHDKSQPKAAARTRPARVATEPKHAPAKTETEPKTEPKAEAKVEPKVEPKILGYSVCWRVLDELHLLNVAVHPEHRGGAIGRRLVEAVLDDGRLTGARVVYLEVRAGNVAARRLYRRLGFRDLGVRRAYYGPGQDAIVMELRLVGER